MARPREFDEEEVLGKALDIFYLRGFEGTSISDLVDATGLSRASLYGAFGDKEELFRRTLEHYRTGAMRLGAKIAAAPTAMDALRGFFDFNIETACPKNGPRGCYMLLSASTSSADNPTALEYYRAMTSETEKTLIHIVERGKKTDELRRDLDVKTTAKLLMVTMQGLSIGARTGRPKSELKQIAEQAILALTKPS